MVRCAGCDHCRDLMADTSCTFFAELYRLMDREKATGAAATPEEERSLAALCTLCGICPCPPIRAGIREAKALITVEDGLPVRIRWLQDVARVGRLASAAPKVINFMARSEYLARVVKQVAGIHPARTLPTVPPRPFDHWAKEHYLDRVPETTGRKVAYFVGCSARYLFPEVAIATVELLRQNGIAVYVPPQKCCGTPSMLEGDKPFTIDAMASNVEHLAACVDQGFDIVCSCPSCGYMLKGVLREGAEYSAPFRERLEALSGDGGGERHLLWERLAREKLIGGSGGAASANLHNWQLTFVTARLFPDDGYFTSLDPLARLRIANSTFDLAEYLLKLEREGALARPVRTMAGRAVYYAPCHQREQNAGTPWLPLLRLIPGLQVSQVGDPFDCCGQAGIHGFKAAAHERSVAIATPLMERIDQALPDYLVTDCLSCRVQFEQLRGYQVIHPVELLWQASGFGNASDRMDAAQATNPSNHKGNGR
jgi:glycerol-3-phosphate dehydrogenase subunit C